MTIDSASVHPGPEKWLMCMACAGTHDASPQLLPVALNRAETDCEADRVTVHEPVPEQPPPIQPANVEPASALAVSVTTVPDVTLALQLAPQLISARLESLREN